MANSKTTNKENNIIDASEQVEIKTATSYPDPVWHQYVSFIKSGVRIAGYVILPFDIIIAAGILVVSEVLGIVEELV